MALRTVEMDFEYQNLIEAPPRAPHQLYAQACSNDQITVTSWRETWLKQIKENHDNFGPFKDRSLGLLFNKFAQRPVICAGSGPSLRFNGEGLKNTKGIPIVSCLHNFQFMVDRDIPVEAYVTLDAGPVTIEEISEGGSKDHQYYVDATKDKTLIAYIGSHPKLLELWKGPIYFFNCPVPDPTYMESCKAIENFGVWVSSGGNVLGASAYIAKAIFGGNPLAFIGADFSFSYTKKFHGWDSKYDKDIGQAMRANDVWGNRVLTWQSYWNFKTWFDYVACTVPGLYVNCTEGGIMGAYPEGNIAQIMQMPLQRFIRMYSLNDEMKNQCEDPACGEQKILF